MFLHLILNLSGIEICLPLPLRKYYIIPQVYMVNSPNLKCLQINYVLSMPLDLSTSTHNGLELPPSLTGFCISFASEGGLQTFVVMGC